MDTKTGQPDTSRLQRLALWLMAAILLFVPLFLFTETRDQFELPKQLLLRAFSSLLLGALLAWRLQDPAQGWRRGPLDWPVLAWSLWLLVGTVLSVAPAVSWRGEYENFAGSLTQLNYSLIYFAAVQVLRDQDDLRRLLRCILAAALAAGLYGILQALQRDAVLWAAASVVADRFFGPMGNPNFLGGLMAMAIPLKLALGLDAQRRDQADPDLRWRFGVLGLLLLFYAGMGQLPRLAVWSLRPGADLSSAVMLWLWLASLPLAPWLRRLGRPRSALWTAQGADLLIFFQVLANTGTRGAFLGLMIGIAVLALGWLRRLGGSDLRRHAPRLLAALGLLALLTGGAFIGLGQSFRQRMVQTLRDPMHAVETSRLQIWGPALEIWKAHPIAGTGVDSFKTVFPSYSRSRFNKYDGENVSSRMAHCEPLQVAATQGSVGLALWFWLCGAFFVAWWRGLREPDAPLAYAGIGALAAAYLGQNLVSFGVAGISVPFWAALAWPAPLPQRRWSLPWKPLGRTAALAAGLGVAGLGLWAASWTLRADLGYAFASQAQDQLGKLDQAGMDELRGIAAYCYQRLGAPASPKDPDIAQEFELWRPALLQWETRLNQDPSAAAELAPLYRRVDGVYLMLLAARSLEQSVRLCPSEVKYRVYQGLAYEELFKRAQPDRRELWFKRAVAAYQASTRLNPGNAYYQGNLGRLYGMAAEGGIASFLPLAEQSYLAALELAPVTRLFYENLLLLYARFAQLDAAGAVLDKVEARDKELAPSLLMAGASTLFQWSQGSDPAWTPELKRRAPEAAAGWARRALALDPGNGDYALALSVFELAAGHRAEAKRWAAEASRLRPDSQPLKDFVRQKGLDR